MHPSRCVTPGPFAEDVRSHECEVFARNAVDPASAGSASLPPAPCEPSGPSASSDLSPKNRATPAEGIGSRELSTGIPWRFARLRAAFSAFFTSRWRLSIDMRDFFAMGRLYMSGRQKAIRSEVGGPFPDCRCANPGLGPAHGAGPCSFGRGVTSDAFAPWLHR